MAAADPIQDGAGSDISRIEWDKIRKVRRLRELYKGRFTNRESATLLQHHNWDLIVTNSFILDALPGELRDVLGENDWQVVESVRRDNTLRELARLARIGHEVRQYGCKDDDKSWWRRVPIRKPVSRCFDCRTKYDPIPREKEWGLGQLKCVCNHEFMAFAMMDLSDLNMGFTGRSKHLCHRCYSHLCEPIKIIPPMKPSGQHRGGGRRRGRNRGRNTTHSCTAPNCYRRRQPSSPLEPIVYVCVHPNSLNSRVPGDGSLQHASSGSTVKTFLSQSDIDQDEYEPSLSDIDEIDNEVDDNI